MVILVLLGAVAWGADEPEGPDEEVIVYGERLVDQARREVVAELEEAGFSHEVLDLGDRVVYRHAEPWKGEVVLHDDGYAKVRRQPLHAEGLQLPWAKRNTPVAWAGCLIWPWACVRASGSTVGTRKWRGRETRTVQQIQPKVQVWADRIADLAVNRKVEGLPAMLQALWEAGRPLSGRGSAIPTYRGRRQALLEFHATRTDTPWGRQVQDAVAAFVRGVVQPSDHPLTASEIERLPALQAQLLRIGPPAEALAP